MKKIILVIAFLIGYNCSLTAQSMVSIFAGGGSSLGDGVPATTASLSGAEGLCADGAGNIYIMETGYQRVRKVTAMG